MPENPIAHPLYPDRVDTLGYTEKGRLHCTDPGNGERRGLTLQGFEADRETLFGTAPISQLPTKTVAQIAGYSLYLYIGFICVVNI